MDISNNVDEILHALDIPFDSDDENCDILLSDDELLEGLEDLDVFNQVDTVIDINDSNPLETPLELPKTTNNYNKKLQNVNRDKPYLYKRSTSPVKVYSNVRWKKGNLIMNEQFLKFNRNTDLPSEIKNLQTPLEFFKYFFDDALLQKILFETIRFSSEKNINKPLKISIEDLKKFIGILVMMSIVHLSN